MDFRNALLPYKARERTCWWLNNCPGEVTGPNSATIVIREFALGDLGGRKTDYFQLT